MALESPVSARRSARRPHQPPHRTCSPGTDDVVVCSLTTDSLPAKVYNMSSVRSVQAFPDLSLIGPSGGAQVTVLARDPFGVFLRAAARERVRRLTIVSPWITAECPGCTVTFCDLVRRVGIRGGSFVLITRPPTTSTHAQAVDCVRQAPRGVVHLNRRLHAKLFICEPRDRRGFAVIGSANATARSASLDELAVLLRPTPNSRIITNLAGVAVRGLISSKPTSS